MNIKKKTLQGFIDRYYLAGNTSSVKVVSNGTLQCDFMTDDQNVVGSIQLNNNPLEEGTLGVYTTDQFIKLLSAVSDDINVDFEKLQGSKDKISSLKISDSDTDVTYVLADLSVIKDVPKISQEPSYDVEIKITKEFIDKFIKAKNAIPDAENFGVVSDGNAVEIVINYSTINQNKIKFKTDVVSCGNMNTVCFSANIFKEILNANKGCEGTLKVSHAGLARAEFTDKEFNTTYFLVQLQVA